MSAIYALYDDGTSAQQAVDNLHAAGVSDQHITVVAAEPLEDYAFSHIGSRTWLWYTASAGGLLGFLFATWFTRFTQLAWPVPTGNMPIVAWWPNLIIMFELTMLGAIVATVVTLVVSAGLLRRRPALYDPEVTNGKILVGVEGSADTPLVDLEPALRIRPEIRTYSV